MKKNIPLAILSGLLLWIAWPPTPYTTFLLFIGFVPMLLAMENIIQSTSAKKGKQIFNTAFIGFFVWNVGSVYWVYNALKQVGNVAAIPVTLIPYSLGPLLMATACWLYYRLRLLTGRSWGLAGLVCLWIGYEYLHQSWDLNFPWMTLGNGFAVSHQWIQWYEYTGIYGGSVWIWMVNILAFLIYIGLREAQTKQLRLKLISGFVLAIVLPMGFSLYTYYNYTEQSNPSNIVAVQPNIDPYEKEGTIPTATQIDIMVNLSKGIAQPNTEFILWPETAIPDYIDEYRIQQNPYYRQAHSFLRNYKNGNLVTGAETYKLYNTRKTATASPTQQPGVFADSFSTALNIENGDKVQFYHKSRLVPGAESLPFGKALSFLKPVFEHLGGATGAYGSQADADVFYSQSGIGVDPVICYESIFGGYIARSVKKGAQFIAIITNDGWWENTSGKDQHLDYAKLRAIETRRWVAQSANTGISAFINQRGDVVQQTKWWTKTAIKQDINLNSDLTFYVMHGDYLPMAGSGIAVLIILFIIIKPRFKKKLRTA
ncbi:apolipoprotein N-acyltransferase [Mucilaginibacter sp. OK283]|jgi:apolipoprotein N-acyltransferase|uniref:apolipoprotein N-acyltransferase n=1 Tax=Mucilaginibacter sp. OK283 TaxID=1881049 RepID=UPI0008B73049|nr:apolipoprotein N-acyltransferase [Mucilaginibacter sp. OK283]SEP46114.1 apolipoprotein N-acyltransferase [Mucilaginibacter sp. OK283]